MRNETYDGTVGVTKDAQQINCTDEEARILLRNPLPIVGGVKPRGPVRAFFDYVILNPGAAFFFGTLGYWTFGCLAIAAASRGVYAGQIYVTGIHPLDAIINNPLIMLSLCVLLLLIGASSDNRERPSLFKWLGVLVGLASYGIALLATMLMGLIVFIGFLASQGAFSDKGTLMMFLIPAGYLAFCKMVSD
jgi:hypothetical protein